MFWLKIGIVVVLATISVFFGAQAGAWRRACIFIARQTKAAYQYILAEEGIDVLSDFKLSNDDIQRFTPRWVSLRDTVAILFLLVTTITGFIMFRWYMALGVAIGTYAMMELAAFALPKWDHPYYVLRLYDTFRMSQSIATRFGDVPSASDMSRRMKALNLTFPECFGSTTHTSRDAE